MPRKQNMWACDVCDLKVNKKSDTCQCGASKPLSLSSKSSATTSNLTKATESELQTALADAKSQLATLTQEKNELEKLMDNSRKKENLTIEQERNKVRLLENELDEMRTELKSTEKKLLATQLKDVKRKDFTPDPNVIFEAEPKSKTDVRINTSDGKILQVHSAFLSNKSKVFASAFTLDDQHHEIHLDIDAKTAQVFIECLYASDCNIFLKEETALPLYLLFHQYEMDEFLQKWSKFIENYLENLKKMSLETWKQALRMGLAAESSKNQKLLTIFVSLLTRIFKANNSNTGALLSGWISDPLLRKFSASTYTALLTKLAVSGGIYQYPYRLLEPPGRTLWLPFKSPNPLQTSDPDPPMLKSLPSSNSIVKIITGSSFVECNIEIKSIDDPSKFIFQPEPKNQLDLTIITSDDKIIQIHSSYLYARSTFFMTHFLEKKSFQIDLPSQLILSFIRSLYTIDISQFFYRKNTVALYLLFHKYQMDEYTKCLEKHFKEFLEKWDLKTTEKEREMEYLLEIVIAVQSTKNHELLECCLRVWKMSLSGISQEAPVVSSPLLNIVSADTFVGLIGLLTGFAPNSGGDAFQGGKAVNKFRPQVS